MTWILWIQLTTTAVCSPASPCAPPVVAKQQFPRTYQTQDVCEQARATLRGVYGKSSEVESKGVRSVTTAKLWCAPEEK